MSGSARLFLVSPAHSPRPAPTMASMRGAASAQATYDVSQWSAGLASKAACVAPLARRRRTASASREVTRAISASATRAASARARAFLRDLRLGPTALASSLPPLGVGLGRLAMGLASLSADRDCFPASNRAFKAAQFEVSFPLILTSACGSLGSRPPSPHAVATAGDRTRASTTPRRHLAGRRTRTVMWGGGGMAGFGIGGTYVPSHSGGTYVPSRAQL